MRLSCHFIGRKVRVAFLVCGGVPVADVGFGSEGPAVGEAGDQVGIAEIGTTEGDRIGMTLGDRGFGSLGTRQRLGRIGRNPRTGARVDVPAKRIPYFRLSKDLKALINQG